MFDIHVSGAHSTLQHRRSTGQEAPMIPDQPATREEIRQHLESEDWVWLQDAYEKAR